MDRVLAQDGVASLQYLHDSRSRIDRSTFNDERRREAADLDAQIANDLAAARRLLRLYEGSRREDGSTSQGKRSEKP